MFTIRVINNYALVVTHEGYPKTLFQFIRREIWHGRGDCATLSRVKESKIALLAILFFTLNLLSVSSLVFGSGYIVGLAGMLLVIGICVALTLYKYGYNSIVNIVVVGMLYYFYLIARFLSFVPSISYGTDKSRHKRSR